MKLFRRGTTNYRRRLCPVDRGPWTCGREGCDRDPLQRRKALTPSIACLLQRSKGLVQKVDASIRGRHERLVLRFPPGLR
jgi:hypothetical protein